MDNPYLIVLGAFGIVLNLLFSGGTMFKLIEFAKDYGAVKEKVRSQGEEIERLRDFSHDLREGRIPIVHHQVVHRKGET